MNNSLKLTESYYLHSPAKVNLGLRIIKQRPDGYHQLITWMLPVSLTDKLSFLPAEDKAWLKLTHPKYQLLKSCLKIFEESLKLDLFLDLHLNKIIPHQAGLGGSSSNAGALIYFLIQHFKLKLSQTELKELCLRVGADVYFFIKPRSVLARRIGQDLCDFPLESNYPAIIIKPAFNISTAEAFSSVKPSGIDSLSSADIFKLEITENDFWQMSLPHFSKLKDLKDRLTQLSPEAKIFLSGSGSALVLVFKTSEAISKLLATQALLDFEYYPCQLLSSYNYQIKPNLHQAQR